jgi:hypothetical protein
MDVCAILVYCCCGFGLNKTNTLAKGADMERGQCQACGREINKDQLADGWKCCPNCCRKAGYATKFGLDCEACPVTQKKQGKQSSGIAAETA